MNWQLPRRSLTLLSLLILALTALPVATAQGPRAAEKIEPALLDKLSGEGHADLVVRFAEQADLSPAYQMGWQERGEFVVQSLSATAEHSQARVRAYLEGRGIAYRTFIAGNEIYIWAGDLLAADALAALPEVAAIRAARTYSLDPIVSADPVPQQATTDWGITDTKADQFWSSFGVKGNGIVVASIDTGVQWDHPALVNQFRCPGSPADPSCWYDPANICGGAACDNNGHGTHTMGTMVAADDAALQYIAGMAPNAKWIACKGCETTQCSDSSLLACADWILQPGDNPANRPHVVNNSWGGAGGEAGYLAKVNVWRAAGIFPAFSAGNSGADCGSLGSPGDYQESFGTAAHDSTRRVADYSSRGPSAFGHDPYTKPNLSAPGSAICSTVPTDDWSCLYSGTSMASPHTAGAVALLWSCNPGLVGQIDQTFQLLQNTADAAPAGNCGAPPDGQGNYAYGYGFLNVLAAGQLVCNLPLGYLTGHVYDTVGNPLAGATVTASPARAIDATTDPSGLYSMTLVPGTYDVTAAKNNYTPQTVGGILITADTTAVQDFNLTFIGAWITGTNTCFDLYRFDAEFFPGTQQVYILGGRSGTDTNGNIYAFDPAAGTCADTGADMPVPISNYTANLVNDGTRNLLCTFGGRTADGSPTLDVQCYDPSTNAAAVVTQLPSAWTGYVPGAQVVLNNKVYIFGGFNPDGPEYLTARTDRYDPVANSFTQLGDLSIARAYIFAAAVDGKVYAFGGDTFDGASLIPQSIAEVMADPEGAGTWDDAAVADLPAAADEGRAFGFDTNSGYRYAGQVILTAMSQWSGNSNAVIAYDVASNTYDETFPDLINARRNHAAAFVPLCTANPNDGQPGMWVFGGYATSDNPPFAPAEFYPMPCLAPAPPVCTPFPRTAAAALTADPKIGVWMTTDFQAVNLAMDSQPITARFVAPNGETAYAFSTTLRGGATGVFTPGNHLPAAFVGTLVLETPILAAMDIVHLEASPEGKGNTIFPGVDDALLSDTAYTPIDGCTRLYVHNLNPSSPATLYLYIFAPNGEQIRAEPYTIPPEGMITLNPVSELGLAPNFYGMAVLNADRRIEVTVHSTCRGYSSFVAAPHCSIELLLPHVPPHEPGVVTTTITILNPNPAMASVNINYGFTPTYPLYVAPWGMEIQTPIVPPTGGPVTIHSDVPVIAVVQSTRGTPTGGGTDAYRAVAYEEATRAAALPVLFGNYQGWSSDSSIWVMNAAFEGGSSDFKIRFSTPDGQVFWQRSTLYPGDVWQVTPPPELAGRAAAIVLSELGDPLVVLAGGVNATKQATTDGQMHYAGTNFPLDYEPVSSPHISYTIAADGRTFTFLGSAAGTAPISYEWDFGDGSHGSGQPMVHFYGADGTYTVAMTATNVWGFNTATTSANVIVEGVGPAHWIYLPVIWRN